MLDKISGAGHAGLHSLLSTNQTSDFDGVCRPPSVTIPPINLLPLLHCPPLPCSISALSREAHHSSSYFLALLVELVHCLTKVSGPRLAERPNLGKSSRSSEFVRTMYPSFCRDGSRRTLPTVAWPPTPPLPYPSPSFERNP